MSTVDQPNASAAPEGARPDPAATGALPVDPPMRASRTAPARPAPRRGGGSVALAVLLALVAVAAAGYVGFRQWQQAQGGAAEQRNVASLQQRVATLETTLTALDDQRGSLNQRLDDAAQVNRSLREELLGQAERTRHLEDALA